MRAPDPLWSGDDDQGLRAPAGDADTRPLPPVAPPEERPRFLPPAPPTEPPTRRAPADDGAPREPRGRRRRLPVALGVLGGMLLAVAAFLIGTWVDHVGSSKTITVAQPLPAAKGGTDATQTRRIYQTAGKSVVQVRRSGGSGTGFVIQGTPGTIVTNAHVVGTAKTVQLVIKDGGQPIPATVLGADESSDLAVVRADDVDDLDGLPALPLAESDDVQVGDLAVAIGYPLGLDRTVTQGIVSGIGRQIEAPNGFSIDKVIQTDAPINPGNSGGPLLDSRGRVMGVNSQIATAGSQGNVGIGFAVPSDAVRDVVPVLEQGGTIRRPYLGVTTTPTTDGRPGASVYKVEPGGPASDAGLKAGSLIGGTGGDTIVAIDGQQVSSPDDVGRIVGAHKAGDELQIRVRRSGGDDATVKATLAARPKSAGP